MPPLTARQKMLSGDLYDPNDPELTADRLLCRRRLRELAASSDDPALPDRFAALKRLFGSVGEGSWIEPPFACDYGTNISLGKGVFLNFNCVILDPLPVTLADGVLIGPAVQIYTVGHPLNVTVRRTLLESGKPVRVEANAWIGGGAILLPGVTVGAGAVVAAGSVVTRDVPPLTLVAGNPARVVRSLA